MSFMDEVVGALQADGELASLLTGGIYGATQVEEISRQNTPEAFDANKEIKPCALVTIGTEVRAGPHHRGVATTMGVYFYQRFGYEIIDQAMQRTFEVLHEQRIGGDGVWQIFFNINIPNQRDPALDCALGSQRYVAYRELLPEGS